MGLEGEGSGGRGGGKWVGRGREVGIRYPLSTPSILLTVQVRKWTLQIDNEGMIHFA